MKQWRTLLANKPALFATARAPTNLLAAALASSSIAQYVLTDNEAAREEHCLVAARLVLALFQNSLPHPSTALGFAVYYPLDIWPNDNTLFRESDRIPAASVVDRLGYAAQQLIECEHYADALPLVSLVHYIAAVCCRDMAATVAASLLRVQALIPLGMISEAMQVLSEVMDGRSLPHGAAYSEQRAQLAAAKLSPIAAEELPYKNHLPLEDPANDKAWRVFLTKRVVQIVVPLYGAHVVSKIGILRAQLLLCAACAADLSIKEEHTALPSVVAASAQAAPAKGDAAKKTDKGAKKDAGAPARPPSSLRASQPVSSEGGEPSVAQVCLESAETGLNDLLAMILRPESATPTPAPASQPSAKAPGTQAEKNAKKGAGGQPQQTRPETASATPVPPLDLELTPQQLETVFWAQYVLSRVYAAKGKTSAAVDTLGRTMQLAANASKKEDAQKSRPLHITIRNFISCRVLLCRMLVAQGRYKEALQHCAIGQQECNRIHDERLAVELHKTAAHATTLEGKNDDALAFLEEAKAEAVQSECAGAVLISLANKCLGKGNSKDATVLYQKAVDLFTQLAACDHPQLPLDLRNAYHPYRESLVKAQMRLASCYLAQGPDKLAHASALLTAAVELMPKTVYLCPPDKAELLLLLAQAQRLSSSAILNSHSSWGLHAPQFTAGTVREEEPTSAQAGTQKEWALELLHKDSWQPVARNLLQAAMEAGSRGFFEHALLKTCLVELCFAFGCSLATATSPTHYQTLTSLTAYYLDAATRVYAAHSALGRLSDLVDEATVPSVHVQSLPEIIALDLVEERGSAAATTDWKKPPPATATGGNSEGDPVSIRCLSYYYHSLLREREALSSLFAPTSLLQAKLSRLHCFLRSVCAPYASKCCIAEPVDLPPKQGFEVPPGGMTAVWFSPDPSKQTMKLLCALYNTKSTESGPKAITLVSVEADTDRISALHTRLRSLLMQLVNDNEANQKEAELGTAFFDAMSEAALILGNRRIASIGGNVTLTMSVPVVRTLASFFQVGGHVRDEKANDISKWLRAQLLS